MDRGDPGGWFFLDGMGERMAGEQFQTDLVWVMICSALVMLMQAGFCLLESGLARSKNSINVAIKNLIDFCVAMVAFWMFGYAVMFGASWSGFIGQTRFMPGAEQNPRDLTFFIFQAMFCGTATTIISGAVAERMRFVSYLAVSLLVSGAIYPIFGHWAWGGSRCRSADGLVGAAGFHRFRGIDGGAFTGGMGGVGGDADRRSANRTIWSESAGPARS